MYYPIFIKWDRNVSKSLYFVFFLVSCCILPISGLEWNLHASQHITFHLEHEYTSDQLKNKSTSPSKTNIPTGNPNMPECVHESKVIRKLIVKHKQSQTTLVWLFAGLNSKQLAGEVNLSLLLKTLFQ